nr:tetratricopeptide repeat protein [uncultured Rhodopila sp.]
MRRAVANAIDIYVTEIAGAPERTNLGEAVDRAIIKAKQQAAAGQGRTARATLRRTADGLRLEEAERRAAYAEQLGTVLRLERDLALAGYDADGAADAILALAESLHPDDRAARRTLLIAESGSLHEFGEQRGSNVHLEAAIAVRRATLALAATPDETGHDPRDLGRSLATRGERDADTAQLEQAVAAYRDAPGAYTRERAPLNWATIQNNLGASFQALGERESGTGRLEEAVTACRDALRERTRARVPLDWAMTQNNLGAALAALGERESGTARLEEAVTAFRDALLEYTRERVPLDWATTQNNLGAALQRLGEHQSGTTRLEEAVTAYRAALVKRARARVPLQWAGTQNNLGLALASLGERESSTARLEEAVTAFRNALPEWSRARVPLDWAGTQHNLGNALATLGERESGTARLEEAVTAYRDALLEWTRARAAELGLLAPLRGQRPFHPGAVPRGPYADGRGGRRHAQRRRGLPRWQQHLLAADCRTAHRRDRSRTGGDAVNPPPRRGPRDAADTIARPGADAFAAPIVSAIPAPVRHVAVLRVNDVDKPRNWRSR